MASGKQDTDLLDFERSLRQLELLADTSTPTKRQSNTRNQEARSNTFNDVAFMPSPDAHQALATEQNMDLPDRKPSQSPRRDNQAGGNSTRRPSFSDLMTDSVLHGGGGVYEQMKRNMERTIERENERHQRRKTLRQIKDRDASEKARQAALQDRNRRNKSEAIRERDKSPGKEHRSRADEPRRQPRREQQRRDPSKNLFTQSRSPSHRRIHFTYPPSRARCSLGAAFAHAISRMGRLAWPVKRTRGGKAWPTGREGRGGAAPPSTSHILLLRPPLLRRPLPSVRG